MSEPRASATRSGALELERPGGAGPVSSGAPDLSAEALTLAALGTAPDFHVAVERWLSSLVDDAGATNAVLFLIDRGADELAPAAAGWDSIEPWRAIPLTDVGHPFVVSALAARAVSLPDTAALRIPGEPQELVLLPLPAVGGAPVEVMDGARAEALLQLHGGELRESVAGLDGIALRPGGVVILDIVPGESTIQSLEGKVWRAGPLLLRLWEREQLAREARRAVDERARLSTIIDALPDPIVITDPANDLLVQNARAEHLFGTREDDSEGRRRAVEINNLLFTSFLSRSAMKVEAGGGARELNLVDPDEGADLLFEVIVHPLSPGEPSNSSLSVLRDVTDLRRAGLELEQQIQRVRLAEFDASRERDRLNLILENVADPILVTDDRADILLMNVLAERLFQPDERGADDRRRMAAVRNNDAKLTSFISDFVLRPDSAMRAQMTLTDPDGVRELPVEVVSGKINNAGGEPVAIVSVLHDLTEQVENERLYDELKKFSAELEERVRAATLDLEAQNQQLQWQSRELEKASRLKSEFLASMSHELRTPINAVIGYTSLLLDRVFGKLSDQQSDGLERIRGAARHLQSLIDDILDLAKVEAGRMPMHVEEVDVHDFVVELAQQIEPMVRKKSLEFTYQVDVDCPQVSTDRVRLKQVLLNLLSNAVKFTPRGSVSLTSECLGDSVRFEVSDTGIGIREDDLAAIWDDFRQVDQSRTREFGGTGLGLSIVRKLLERMGGRVEVRSAYGEGSTFVVILPVRITLTSDDIVIVGD